MGRSTGSEPDFSQAFQLLVGCVKLLGDVPWNSSPAASTDSWHWPRDTQLKEEAHRYRESNGVQIIATLRSLAMNALRLDGYWSITEGLASLSHDIRGLLALFGWRESAQGLGSG